MGGASGQIGVNVPARSGVLGAMDLTRAARRAPWIAAAAVLVAGVVGGAGIGWSAEPAAAWRPTVAADADPAVAAGRLGECAVKRPVGVDFLPATEKIQRVDRWLEPTAFLRPADATRAWPTWEPVGIDLVVRDLARPAAAPHPERVLMDGDEVAGIDWALRSGGRAFLALDAATATATNAADANATDTTAATGAAATGAAATGAAAARRATPEHVSYVLVRHRAGPHFFAGFCAAESLTWPLQRLLPTRYDAAMASLIGLKAAEVVPALLAAQRDERVLGRPAGR